MKKFLALTAFFVPSLVLAQTTITNVDDVTKKFIGIGNTIIYLLTSLAVIYIIWNIVQYFIKGKEGESRNAAGMNIVWGIVGLFIIISIWGLVNILSGTFKTVGVNNPIPTLPAADRALVP